MNRKSIEAVVVLDAGSQLYREYALRSISEEATVILVGEFCPEWARPYVTHWIAASPLDTAKITCQLKRIPMPVLTVITYYEFYVEAAARLSISLGLPTNSEEVAALSRDKYRMRQAFMREGVSSPTSILAHSDDYIAEAAHRIGFPVVIKPRNLAGSIGVVLALDEDGLKHAIAAKHLGQAVVKPETDMFGETLVEEYVDGREVSVESVVANGLVNLVAVTHKRLGQAPYFEEVGHTVSFDKDGQSLLTELGELVAAAHSALGIEWGITHTEVRFGVKGAKVIEIATRAGGDQILKLVKLASGLDVFKMLIDAYRGRAINTSPILEKCASIDFIYPDRDGALVAVDYNLGYHDNVASELCIEVPFGSILKVPPSAYMNRAAFLITVGESDKECEIARSENLAAIKVEMA